MNFSLPDLARPHPIFSKSTVCRVSLDLHLLYSFNFNTYLRLKYFILYFLFKLLQFNLIQFILYVYLWFLNMKHSLESVQPWKKVYSIFMAFTYIVGYIDLRYCANGFADVVCDCHPRTGRLFAWNACPAGLKNR